MKLSYKRRIKKRVKFRLSVALFSGLVFVLLMILTDKYPSRKSLLRKGQIQATGQN